MATSLLQQLFAGGSREGCFFDPKSSREDVSLVCHDAQGAGLAGGEQAFFSVRDVRRPASDQTAPLGAACHLRSAELDTTLALRLWAGNSQGSSRVVGELQIPLARVVTQCHGMLYRTWISLNNPGLCESVGSGLLGDDLGASSFEQNLAAASGSLQQPRICVSICKTSELGPDGCLLLKQDAKDDTRVARWGALLRSQQQHARMSAVLHAQAGSGGDDEGAGEELRSLVAKQAAEIDQLKRQLREGPPAAAAASSADAGGFGRPPKRPSVGAEDSVRNAERSAEVESLRTELDRLSEEANKKIDAANERIRTLRWDRDEARGEASRLQEERRRLDRETEVLNQEMRQLSEQKEALMEIVEDLHRSCQAAGRNSIDTITANFRIA